VLEFVKPQRSPRRGTGEVRLEDGEPGSYRGPAAMRATTPKTVKLFIERHEGTGWAAVRPPWRGTSTR
jgi:hypothetical protein